MRAEENKNDECGMMNDELRAVGHDIHHSSFIIHHSPTPSAFCILFLGDAVRSEFRDARHCLNRWGSVHELATPEAATALLSKGAVVPDVIVVAQAFPGQFSHQAIDHLRRLAPLARVVGLMGSWCEGETRTGSPWPGVVRTYWHQWAARSNRELSRLTQGNSCSWSLPPTATEEERLLADKQPVATNRRTAKSKFVGQAVPDAPVRQPDVRHSLTYGLPSQRGLVLICTPSREMAEWLAAACKSRGYSTVWQRAATTARVEGTVAAILDGPDLDRVVAAWRPVPVVALLAFPRIEDQRRALSAGAAAVVSKPLAVDDLFWELERVQGKR